MFRAARQTGAKGGAVVIIDVHAHYTARDDYLEALAEACRENGVDRVCLNSGGALWGQRENAAVLDAARRFPDLVVPFDYVDLDRTTPEDLDRFVADGFRGFKSQNPALPYDSKTYWPLYERAEAHGLCWLFHTGVTARYPGESDPSVPRPPVVNVSSARMRPVRLDAVARAFRGLTIVGAHLGIPWCAEAAFLCLPNPNLYFDLSGVDLTGKLYPSLVPFNELFWSGPEHWGHLVFGTEGNPANYNGRMREHRDLFSRYGVSPAIQDRIMGHTIGDVLGLTPGDGKARP